MSGREFDVDKDYYAVLGLNPTVGPDELKAAYVQLALQHHPDTAKNFEGFDSKDAGETFKGIAEAWNVLSKPDIRKQYDDRRNALLMNRFPGMRIATHSPIRDYADAGGGGGGGGGRQSLAHFATQKEHYERNVATDSTFFHRQEKYYSEKKMSRPLEVKKMSRAQPISSGPGTLSKWALMAGLGLSIIVYCNYKFFVKKTK